MKEKKFENDDYSRMAGQDFRETAFSISAGPQPSTAPTTQKTFNGGLNEELKQSGPKKTSQEKAKKSSEKGPDQATKRDLGIEE